MFRSRSSNGPSLLAFLWPAEAGAAEADARRMAAGLASTCPRLRRALSRPGLLVLADPSIRPAHNVPSRDRIVVGDVFGTRLAELDEGGDWPAQLARKIWGRYIAFACRTVTEPPGFMRDPTGAVQAMAFARGALLIVADRLPEPLEHQLGLRLSVDWEGVAQIACEPVLAPAIAALESATVPVPGHWYRWDGERLAARCCWSPARIAAEPVPKDGPQKLRDAERTAVAQLAAGHDTVALELSGGLDSSILAGLLGRLDPAPRIHALNIAPQSPGGDERRYARAAAIHAGAQLTEVAVVPGSLDYLAHRAEARRLTPAVYGFDLLADTISTGHAEAVGATRIFTGQGGDAVFFQPRTNAVLADALRFYGAGRRFRALAMDMAVRRHVSVWSVVRDAVRPPAEGRGTIGGAIAAIAGPRTAAVLAAPRRLHPWVEEATGLLPAKAMQVGLIANCQVFGQHTRTGIGGRLVHPFLQQPVIEAALRLPVPVLTPDRRDRGLARDIFSPELPREIRDRRAKGEATGFYSRAIAGHLAELRPLLLDGRLAANGILDRHALDTLLCYDALMTRDVAGLIAMLISLELWSERWG